MLSLINRANRMAGVIAGGITAAIGFVVCYAVFVRYLLNQPIGWSEEVGTYLMLWAAFLGAGYTLQTDGHIGVDLISRRLPRGIRTKLEIAKHLVGIAFLILLAAKGFEDCLLSFRLGEVSVGALAIPMAIPQAALPVGAVLLGLQMGERLLGALIRSRASQEPDR